MAIVIPQKPTAPQVLVAANPSAVAGAVHPGALGNQALTLASSLQEINGNLQPLLQGVASQAKSKADSAAKLDAMKTAGDNYATAVRKGLIQPTQNPWYIESYNKEAAAVSGGRKLADLNASSTQWPEQSDPDAFQQRYATELNTIAEGYSTPDAQEGFLSAAMPMQQQAFAANTARRVETIKAERVANIGSLVAETTSKIATTAGGKVSAAALSSGLAPLKDQWIGTGGTEADWNQMVIDGVSTAALRSGNASLMDSLKGHVDGKGSLYDIPDAASKIEAVQNHIESESRQRLTEGVTQQNAAIALQGNQLQKKMFADPQFGEKLLKGTFDVDAYISTAKAQGFDDMAIRSSLNQISAGVSDVAALQRARLSPDSDPVLTDKVNTFWVSAQTKGYSPELETDLGKAILDKSISVDDAQKIRAKASETSRLNDASDRRDPNNIPTYAALNDRITNAVALMAVTYSKSKGGGQLGDVDRKRLTTAATDAARSHLDQNPDDFIGALNAGRTATAQWIQQKRQRKATQTSNTNQRAQ